MVSKDPGARGSAAPADPAGPTGQLATWLARTTLADIPAEVRSRARYLLLDGVGCLLVGAQLPWSRTGVEAVTALDGEGTSMIAGWDKTTSAPSAAMLNSSFIQGFELDDYFPPAPLHANSIVLPALMAAAGQKPGTTGAQFLLGAILGYEVGPRVGLALHGGQMLSRGWHSGAVFGPPAAAAAAGSLYELTAAGFEDALGIAATQSCGLMSAQFESMVKRMQHGFAARNGLYAAALACRGYVGIKRVFERDYGGFLSVFGEGHDPDPDQIAAGLGTRWDTARYGIKPYAAMGGLHAAIDAVLAMQAQAPINPAQVSRIRVDVSHPVYQHGGFDIARPIEPITAQMSLKYTVPVVILDAAALISQYRPDRINDDDVLGPDRQDRSDPRPRIRPRPGRRLQNPGMHHRARRQHARADHHAPARRAREPSHRRRDRRQVPHAHRAHHRLRPARRDTGHRARHREQPRQPAPAHDTPRGTRLRCPRVARTPLHHARVAGQDAAGAVERDEGADGGGGLVLAVRDVAGVKPVGR